MWYPHRPQAEIRPLPPLPGPTALLRGVSHQHFLVALPKSCKLGSFESNRNIVAQLRNSFIPHHLELYSR